MGKRERHEHKDRPAGGSLSPARRRLRLLAQFVENYRPGSDCRNSWGQIVFPTLRPSGERLPLQPPDFPRALSTTKNVALFEIKNP
jgi:hypothetical protein